MASNSRKQRKQPPTTNRVKKAEVGTPLDEETAAKVKNDLERERGLLDALRVQLDQYAAKLTEDNEALEALDKRVNERRAEVTKDERSLEKEQKKLQEDRAALADRTAKIVQREAEADAGFAARSERALQALEKRLDDVRKAIEREDEDLAKRRITAHKALDDEISKEREARQKALESEIESRRKALEAEIGASRTAEKKRVEKALKDEKAAAAARRADLDKRESTLKAEREKLQKQAADLHGRELEVELANAQIAADRQAIDTIVKQRAAHEVRTLETKLATQDEHLESLRQERAKLEKGITALREEALRFEGMTSDEVLLKLKTLQDDVERLQAELDRAPSADLPQRMRELEKERDALGGSQTQLQRELAKLKGERHTWLLEQAELERQRDLAETARRTRDALLAESERLDAEVQRLRGLYETPKEKQARIGVIEKAWFEDVQRGREAHDEIEWLDGIQERCEEVEMVFPRRLLEAFHTSLKCAEWSALTVLAGVSGTGKSELPRLYSRFGGLAYLPLAVEPNWDSPQSLLGFFNSIDNRFNAKPLLRALVQAGFEPDDRHYDGGLDDRMLLVLLDEMNLAHVELYFSDLLSKLEDRRGKADDETWLDVDLGAGLDPYQLFLVRNVLWTGTMNEDATTKTLSDKVLDRSNLLVFPRPNNFRRRGRVKLPDAAPLIPRSTWQGWLDADTPLDEKQIDPFKTWLEDVNQRLEFVGRALGHRVWQAAEAYMTAHPRVVAARNADDKDALKRALRRAFEDAVVHKVMPKLRGIETSGKSGRECLEPIQKLLGDERVRLNLTEDFQHARTVGQGAFIWSSARYLEADE